MICSHRRQKGTEKHTDILFYYYIRWCLSYYKITWCKVLSDWYPEEVFIVLLHEAVQEEGQQLLQTVPLLPTSTAASRFWQTFKGNVFVLISSRSDCWASSSSSKVLPSSIENVFVSELREWSWFSWLPLVLSTSDILTFTSLVVV